MFGRLKFSMSMIFGLLLIIVVLFMPRGIGYYLYLFDLKYLSRIESFFRRARKMEGKFVDTKFGKIRPLEHGSGENTIIFVHGNLASAIWFKEMFKILPDNYKAYALNLPNFGFSEHIEMVDIKTYSDALHEFVNALKLDNFILLGHSFGGAVVIKYAIEHTEKLSKLVLVDPVPINALKTPEESNPILELYKNNPEHLEKSLKAIAPTYENEKFFKLAVSEALKMHPKCFTENARVLEK